jgi:hypothetical protein
MAVSCTTAPGLLTKSTVKANFTLQQLTLKNMMDITRKIKNTAKGFYTIQRPTKNYTRANSIPITTMELALYIKMVNFSK